DNVDDVQATASFEISRDLSRQTYQCEREPGATGLETGPAYMVASGESAGSDDSADTQIADADVWNATISARSPRWPRLDGAIAEMAGDALDRIGEIPSETSEALAI